MNEMKLPVIFWLVLTVLAQSSLSQADLVTGFKVERIEINGASVFEPSTLLSQSGLASGAVIYVEDVLAAVDRITQQYVDAGYVTSGAYLPQQDLADGVLRIEVKEGQLTSILTSSDGRLKSASIERLLNIPRNKPLHLGDLQQAISRLERSELIETVRGELKPGKSKGESILALQVNEADVFSVELAANNYRSPSVGEEQGEISLHHGNLTGYGDALSLSAQQTDGVDAYSVRYAVPVNALRSKLAVFYAKGETLVVEEPFDAIALESETDTSGLHWLTTWRESVSSQLSTTVGFEKKESLTSLLGLPFDFSPGSVNGLSEASVISAALEFSRRGQRDGWIIRVGYRSGSDDTNHRANDEDGDFSLLRVQGRYLRQLGAGLERPWQLALMFTVQESSDTLPAFERFALGGHGSVRGYRENQLLKDSGELLSASLSFPIGSDGGGRDFVLTGSLFADYGRGENSAVRLNVDQTGSLASVGLGVEAQLRGLTVRAEYAHQLKERESLGDSLQDDGIHIGVRYVF
jgi:hemolysin activation/secretion protein